MFAIHSKVELLKRDGRPLGTYARHYYDLFHLASQAEVITMLKSGEYAPSKRTMTKSAGPIFRRAISVPKV
jgi:hypothetical protein